MSGSVAIDTRDIEITPIFKYVTVEDIPASERAGSPVMKTIEAVEVRFAGSKLYSPTFPVEAFWQRDGYRTVTYAERWADQYKAFLEGNEQKAAGTPLEMLRPYGISDAQLSLCRALKIYSIEALHSIEGQGLKNLQMNGNALKDMARRFMADRSRGAAANDEMEAMRAEIDRLRAQIVKGDAPTESDYDAALQRANAEADPFAAMTDEELKDFISGKVGRRPAGNPNHDTLVRMARESAHIAGDGQAA